MTVELGNAFPEQLVYMCVCVCVCVGECVGGVTVEFSLVHLSLNPVSDVVKQIQYFLPTVAKSTTEVSCSCCHHMVFTVS